MTTQERSSQISQKEALKIVVHLQVVLKLGKFYEPNNRILLEQMETLFSSMQTALEREDEIQIYVSQNSISLNRVRVKFDFATYHASKFLLSAFQEREIGSLIFYLGLTKEELTQFMFFLAEREIPKEDQFEQIFSDFEAASFPHILIEKIPPAEKVETLDKAIVTMYFLGIYHLKDIFEQEDEALNLNLTKRWVQSMFNHLAFDESFLFGLTNVKNFDEYTLNHSVNVCLIAIALGRRLGLSRPELMELGVSALLHDLGKLEIPKDILDKPAKLDAGERAIMETHPNLGAEKLIEQAGKRGIPDRVIQVAFEHHVNIDLSGYPKYVRRTNINLFSKIVKIVDYFDAITTKRVYRPKVFTREEALSLMLEKSGEEFDPLILRTFASMIGVYPIGSLVVLNTGEIGIVVEINPLASFAQKPKVKLIADTHGNKMDGDIVDLTDLDPDTRRFKRTIITSLDADKYNIPVSDYFLLRAQ
jgi:putative nucleotidyltransferase with HDIG domain